MDIDISFLSKEQLRNNLFIVKVGSEHRPASEEDIEDIVVVLGKMVEEMDLDFDPTFLVTHHLVDIERTREIEELRKKMRENLPEINRFEIMEIEYE